MAKAKIGAWDISEEELEQQHRAARRRGLQQAATEPQASKVAYDWQTGQIVIELTSGVTFWVPTQLLEGVAGAAPEDAAQVALGPRGASLHWAPLGVDFSLAGLLAGVLGTRAWMAELGRRGGSVRSDAKASAARANGRKGGRPEKAVQQPLSDFQSTK